MRRKKCLCTVAVVVVMVAVALGMADTAAAKKKKKPVSLSKAVISLSKTSYSYNGKARKPKVTVRLKKKKLKKGRDYKVTYSNNKKVGKARVTITAKNKKKYKGKKSKTFRINKAARTIIPGKSSYSAVEGDGAFTITAKPSKGKGTIQYSCPTSDVIKVSSTGKVTVVKRGTAKVTITVSATASYKKASVTVPVTINKKPVRTVNTEDSIRNFNYQLPSYSCITKKLTDFSWRIVDKYSIPGLAPTADNDLTKGYIQCNNLCPQGLTFAGDYMLTTAYCVDGVHTSCIFIYDKETGDYLNTLVLKEKSHVGGITYDGNNVWICHANRTSLQRIPYTALKKYASGSKKCVNYQPEELKLPDADGYHDIANKPSAVAYNPNDGYIWVTEFVAEPKKSGKKVDDPIMAAYEYRDNELQPVTTFLNTKEEDYLGINTEDAAGETDAGQAGAASGAVVTAVVRSQDFSVDGEEQKLLMGDMVVRLGETDISGHKDLDRALGKYSAGDKVTLTVQREEEGVLHTLEGTMTLGERKTQPVTRVIPFYVQGVAFLENGKTVFSRSYGRNTSKTRYISELMVYDATWDDEDSYTWESTMAVVLPPMAEEVEISGNEVFILFESAAMTYLEGTDGSGKSECPIDQIVAVDLGIND